jgi:hypothetical protein
MRARFSIVIVELADVPRHQWGDQRWPVLADPG